MESDLQTQCENFLKNCGIKYHHKHNNSRQHFRRGTNVCAKGLPDLIIAGKNGVTVYVELKDGEGKKITKEQSEWIDYLKNNMHKVFIVYSFNKFVEILLENKVII